MVFEAEQGFCKLSDYIAENGPLTETQARFDIGDKHFIFLFLFNLKRIHEICGPGLPNYSWLTCDCRSLILW